MASKKSFLDLEKVKAELQKYGVEDTDSEIEKIEKQIKSTLNSYKEKNKIAREQYKDAFPFSEIYKTTEDLNLPNWVLEKIDVARIYGNSKQMIIFPDGTFSITNIPF